MMKKFLFVFLSMLSILGIITAIYPYSSPGYYRNSRSLENKAGQNHPTSQPGIELLESARQNGDRTVSFIGMGDNVIHPNIYMEAAKRGKGSERGYDFKPMYSDIADMIANADISFINQETLMCGDELGLSGYPRFNSPQALGYDLYELGFDVVNIANNHMADKGSAGLLGTINFWNSLPVTLIGGYKDAADYDTPRILEVNDLRIAFLSYTFSTNGLKIYPTAEITALPVLPYLDEEDIRRQTAIAREQADALIISVHWGEENHFKLNDEQIKFAWLMAECGADAIIGHHPHVLQPIEWIPRPDGGRTLCVYSLGNIVSSMENSYNMVGGIIGFDIARRNGRITLENVLLTPTVFFYAENQFGTHIYLMDEYSESLASKHGTIIYGHRDTYEQLKKYVSGNIPSEFLANPQ